jgi:hypothetical protein
VVFCVVGGVGGAQKQVSIQKKMGLSEIGFAVTVFFLLGAKRTFKTVIRQV